MTDQQFAMLAALISCTFGTGSREKRFVRDMASQSKEYELTARQDWYLRRIYYRYRVQLGQPDMAKPADFHEPPLPVSGAELARREAKGQILVCRAPVSADRQRAADLERLQAWNEGKAR